MTYLNLIQQSQIYSYLFYGSNGSEIPHIHHGFVERGVFANGGWDSPTVH